LWIESRLATPSPLPPPTGASTPPPNGRAMWQRGDRTARWCAATGTESGGGWLAPAAALPPVAGHNAASSSSFGTVSHLPSRSRGTTTAVYRFYGTSPRPVAHAESPAPQLVCCPSQCRCTLRVTAVCERSVPSSSTHTLSAATRAATVTHPRHTNRRQSSHPGQTINILSSPANYRCYFRRAHA